VTLRARVLVGLALVAAVLALGAAATTRMTEANLVDQVDDELRAAGGPRRFGRMGSRGDGPPTPFYGAVVTAAGVELLFSPNVTGDQLPAPVLDTDQVRAAAAAGEHFTVGSSGDLRYRVRAVVDPRSGAVAVLALPLDDVDAAVDRLVRVEAVATLAVLGVLGLVAWWVVHLGVRPIKRMTHTASAIAAGDLSARVPDVAAGTEAGELGAALNSMLGRIEDAFAERGRSEERLRRFASDASHELRTPITTIRGYAELYRAGALAEPAELAEAMRRTEQEAVRMGNLVEDLLALARLDQGRPLAAEPVDLGRLVDDAARDARAVDPQRPVDVRADDGLVVTGDEDRLRQVLANVVGNALVHTAPGTPVSLRATRVDGQAVVEVRDEGPGMAPDVAARAFERFYRADPSRSRHRGGTGLGLSIVDATMAAHGGSVELDTRPGAGTTVRIRLPLANSS